MEELPWLYRPQKRAAKRIPKRIAKKRLFMAQMLFLTGHIVSIDEETNTFRLRVIVEDDSERTLEVHFGEKPASGVLVNVSDYKVGDHVAIAYFPYDRKGSYINADSVAIFHEGYDRVRKDDRIPEYIY